MRGNLSIAVNSPPDKNGCASISDAKSWGMHLVRHTQLLLDNYARYFGEDLIARGPDAVERLMAAPFVVLSHGTAADPIFNYGNLAAQKLFELDWAQLTALPSRHSAETLHQAEREALLREVETQGYSNNYRGIRVSATGKRFQIEAARVWMLLDAEGVTVGQAASFSKWIPLADDSNGCL
jgi:hypothetical protein